MGVASRANGAPQRPRDRRGPRVPARRLVDLDARRVRDLAIAIDVAILAAPLAARSRAASATCTTDDPLASTSCGTCERRARLGRAGRVVARDRGAARDRPPLAGRLIGLVLAFGAGALISAVSFDLAGGGRPSRRRRRGRASGSRPARSPTSRPVAERCPTAAAPRSRSGAFLDGIPEQAVLGIGLASGEGVERRPAGGDLRLQPARGDRLGLRHARPPKRKIIAPVGRRRRRLHARDRRRLRDRRRTGGRAARRDRRLRGRRAAGDADRLDDPRRPRKGGAAAGLVTVLGFAVAAALDTAICRSAPTTDRRHGQLRRCGQLARCAGSSHRIAHRRRRVDPGERPGASELRAACVRPAVHADPDPRADPACRPGQPVTLQRSSIAQPRRLGPCEVTARPP